MDNIYILSDAEIMKKISARLKSIRLRQNISRQDIAVRTGLSVSSIARMEDGEIKSFESFLRVVRTLGELDVLSLMIREEEMSPNEYFEMVHSKNKVKRRRRATGKVIDIRQKEDSEW